ncbi:GspH/FimT family pseudopilin [Psychromonas antarctica]|jgi:type IV fimbrial biogenesis protein FimT|uniref:GspH/FimT family pseudopilin n=1 Tax=Psychromonas antarctica TaxID=67573 RepID=UPI001EE90FC7|nr:GspH/FimT family pseudopilin [Psychromonas antarctica]MCG6200384.1 GspH/FimT family pseudopilin [Psychromonas antarctica]
MKIDHRKRAGFTLIELLVTLVVLGILISIGINNYSRLFSQQKLVQKTEHLYHFLRLAKSQSIKYNKKIYVHFCQLGNSGKWKMGMTDQASCDCFTPASCLLNGLEVVNELSDGQAVLIAPSDITFSSNQASYSPMRFSVNAGSVTLADDAGYKLKVIQSTMRLRVCSPEQAQLGYKKC